MRVGILDACKILLPNALCYFCTAGTLALAQDLRPASPAPSETPRVPYLAIDGSALATSLGDSSTDLNATLAPFGDVNQTGFRVRFAGSASWYKFITNPAPLTYGYGHTVEGGILAGYQFSLPRVSFIGLVGGTVAESVDEGIGRTLLGAKAVASMYARPSDFTMAYASVSYSTVANFIQVQSKVGAKLVGNFYVGPEANFSWRNVAPGVDNVALMRLGAHISSVAFGPVQAGISAGWAQHRDLGLGYYGSLNFYLTF